MRFYLERFAIEKSLLVYDFDFLFELQNVCVRIPLPQSITNKSIFTQTIKELCVKMLGRKRKDPPIIKLGGHSTEIMRGKLTIKKNIDPGNPIVISHIRDIPIEIILIDQGPFLNMMITMTLEMLLFPNLRPNPTVLELAY